MIKRNGDNVFAIASNQNNQSSAARSAVSLCPGAVGLGTRIPQPRAARMTPPAPDAHPAGKEANVALGIYVEKWKNKYEDSERKNKACLVKTEKAKREYDDLQRRYNFLAEERNHLEGELTERERELNKLRTVSEKVFQEYQQLKNQQEVDAGVMHKVMQQAGEWYKQNKQLKRRSTVLLQALPNKPLDLDLLDTTDAASDASSNEELEFLKSTVSELSRQLAALQTELSTARLHEFEAHELNVNLSQELESEREERARLAAALAEAERARRGADLLLAELPALRGAAARDRRDADRYKSEAREAKKRVTVLTHQSALLLGELGEGEGEEEGEGGRVLALLAELERQRGALEERAHQIEELEIKLAEKREEADELLWEEKIKLAEEDARKAIERAEKAERRLSDIQAKPPKKSNLMSRINYFENGAVAEEPLPNTGLAVKEDEPEQAVQEECTEVPAAPPPPPPPPPAPPAAPPAPALDMAAMLQSRHGALRKTAQNGAGGAIDAIVDQIKGGKFHLKSTEQNFLERKPREEPPEAVKEMLSILGTLRKRRTRSGEGGDT